MSFFYSLSVVKPIELVAVLIDTLVGNAQLALEGDLSGFDGKGLRGVSREPTLLLKRNTLAVGRADPGLRASDFVIIPLNAHNIAKIKRSVLPRLGFRENVWHVLIARDGELQFAAYDNRNQDSVLAGDLVPVRVLESLKQKGIIASYKRLRASRP